MVYKLSADVKTLYDFLQDLQKNIKKPISIYCDTELVEKENRAFYIVVCEDDIIIHDDVSLICEVLNMDLIEVSRS